MKLFLWLPRALTLAFAMFLSLFALDVFAEGYGFWQTIGALLIHLIPSLILLAVLVLAWHKQHLGGLVFIGLAVLTVFWTRAELSGLLLIGAPILLIGLLFLVSAQLGHRALNKKAGSFP